MNKKHVLIVGGGFAGVEAALKLREYDENITITVLNKDQCFSFTPAIYETAAGELTEDDVCIIIPSIFRDKNIRYFSDEAETIDQEKKVLTTRNNLSISYDYLIVGLGAETNRYDLPGVEEHLIALKTHHEAQKIYAQVTNTLSNNDAYNFVICGGGLTGVEFASMVTDHILNETGKDHLSDTPYTVTLIHSRDSVLHTLPDAVSNFATQYLQQQGITLELSSRVEKATKDHIYTTTRTLPYNLGIWCGGLKTHAFITNNGLPYRGGEMGRGIPGGGMLVNTFLQLIDNDTIFGIGDCVDVQARPPAKTAQNAIHQAHVCAKNIFLHMQGDPLEHYEPIKNKFYVALGKNMGICVDGTSVAFGKEQKERKELLEKLYINKKRGVTGGGSKKYIYL